MRSVRTTCPYCGVGCGIVASVGDARSVKVAGDPDHPANHGRLCSKGTHLAETVGLEGRLLHPMIGNARVAWDTALDAVADRMRSCIAEHGPDSVAFYVSGQLLTEDYYAVNKLAKGFVGTGNIDTNSRLCMASAVAAHQRAFGEDVVPCTYDDLDEADLVLLVGSNTAWCHPVIWQRIEAARAARGTRIVVIDPRRTETAEQADLHVAIPPDGDVALFRALLAAMRDRGALDNQFMEARCTAPDGYIASLSVSEHGIEQTKFDALVDLVTASPRMITLFSQGSNQSRSGTDKGNAIINLHLATGRINQPGMGPFSITGQPNAMGGREVGGLANMLACHLGFSEDERSVVSEFWGTDRLCSGPGLKAVDMFRAVHDGRIKFLWVMATNPAVSMPDASFVREALSRCETLVVSDVMADTDTGRFADILLPAHAWGEKDGTVTNSERMISRQRPLFPPPGDTHADWAAIAGVAQRLGHRAAFGWRCVGDVFREYAAMTGVAARLGTVLDLSDRAALSDAGYAAMAPFRWGGMTPFADRFRHTDGRAHIVPVMPPATLVDPRWPFRLNTGRYRDQWHTMTRTGLSPKLAQHRREPMAELHPQDAADHAIADGALIRIETQSGASLFRAQISAGQRRGELFVPMHWTDEMAGDGRANRLPGQDVDPISGQPGFKNVAATIAPVTPAWRGFLVTRSAPSLPPLLWWSRSRVAGGWLYELAGNADVDVDRLLPQQGVRTEALDVQRGMRRLAVEAADGTLDAALFVTRSGTLPSRDWIAGQLGLSTAGSAEILAARAKVRTTDAGPMLCICHGVRTSTIEAAIIKGADSVAAIGAATCAGTNCGSCRPAISRLLAAHVSAKELVISSAPVRVS